MSVQVNMDEVLQVKELYLEAIEVVGIEGNGPRDEGKLFADFKSRKRKFENKLDENECLVITSAGLIVASAVSSAGEIPDGTVHVTIPANK